MISKNQMAEGYIKFNYEWIKQELNEDITEINKWRKELYLLNLIGIKNEVGFGNISIRQENNFIITGSKTGGIENLTKNHFTKVTSWYFNQNNLTCEGPIEASSESLTHAAIYTSNSDINAVIHVHNLNLWEKLMHKIPTTDEKAEFGTPEMAYEIMKLFRENYVIKKRILVMGGHKEGIISFGKDLQEAGNVLLDYFNLYPQQKEPF
jgi:ribulose-5-phosphate 4-epimerase/fuculose-1-phosphate aldolase